MEKVAGSYKFQFNHDSVSRLALSQLIQQGWIVWGIGIEDGYSWIRLAAPKVLEEDEMDLYKEDYEAVARRLKLAEINLGSMWPVFATGTSQFAEDALRNILEARQTVEKWVRAAERWEK